MEAPEFEVEENGREDSNEGEAYQEKTKRFTGSETSQILSPPKPNHMPLLFPSQS